MAQPWRTRDVVLVAAVQLVGLGVAYVAAWIAFFTLPEEGLFGSENDPATRAWGVVAALVGAVALPAGLWVVAVLRRSRVAAAIALLAAVPCLAVAVGWALPLGP